MARPASPRRPARARRTPATRPVRTPAALGEFTLQRRVQFHETDKAGIVHFSWYFRYMEEAEHALWRAAGLSISPPDSTIGWPRVHASFDFQRALRFEEEFEAVIRITAITNSTIRYSCLLSRDGARIADGVMTIACVRKGPNGSMRSTPIPPAIGGRFRVAAGAGTHTS
jgi:YbgC/YbaW family acyl-CoA thioester hydrolase